MWDILDFLFHYPNTNFDYNFKFVLVLGTYKIIGFWDIHT